MSVYSYRLTLTRQEKKDSKLAHCSLFGWEQETPPSPPLPCRGWFSTMIAHPTARNNVGTAETSGTCLTRMVRAPSMCCLSRSWSCHDHVWLLIAWSRSPHRSGELVCRGGKGWCDEAGNTCWKLWWSLCRPYLIHAVLGWKFCTHHRWRENLTDLAAIWLDGWRKQLHLSHISWVSVNSMILEG